MAASKTSRKLEPYQVVIRPLVTEKGFHKADKLNQYAFEVCASAGKDDIREAVEHLFEVKVLRVNTQTRKGKPRRTKMRQGHTKVWKKAVVTLHPDNRINFF